MLCTFPLAMDASIEVKRMPERIGKGCTGDRCHVR
jgi:hypothetical protein